VPAALPPGKTPVPFELEAGWAPELLWIFGRRRIIFLLMRFKPGLFGT